MNPRSIFPAGLILAAAAVVCAGVAAAAYAGTADSAKPLKGEWDFAPVKVWFFNRAGADTLKRPGEPRVASDGKLYFHDFERHLSYIVDEKGDILGTFAGVGDGPGLISRYINCFTSDCRVIVGSMDKLHCYDHSGLFISTFPNNIFESFPLVFTSDDVFFTAPGALVMLPGGKAAIRKISTTGGEPKTIHEFTIAPEDQTKFGGVILGVIPQINMGYDPAGGRLYFGRNDRYEILVSDLDGKAVGSFGLPKERGQVTEEELRRHMAGSSIPADRVEQLLPLLPRKLTYFHRIQVIDGLVYVFTVDSFDSPIARQDVDIFSLDGKYLYRGRIVMPKGDRYKSFDGMVLSKGSLHAILTNEDGTSWVAKYKVSMPPR
ncbi:MAG: hypothetical protein AB1714_28820 [Acidobacteriota bacterium]